MKIKVCFFALCILIQPVHAMTLAHGIAMHGDLKYPASFQSFDYVNPNAPKGGILKQASFGSFDTLNPFTIKGNVAPGVGLLFDTLMVESADEPFSEYGLIAESIEVPQDRSFVIFNLNPKAKFHDDSFVTGEDVLFSFQVLKEKGLPQYRSYFGDVEKVTILSPLKIQFLFKKGVNRELPLILGQMPVLSKKDWEGKDFTATTMIPPVGSGPYRVKKMGPNRFIVYVRDDNYWAKDLPVRKGQYNFDEIRYDIYRDTTVAVEAFKSGAFDVREENEAKKWETAYDCEAFKEGKVIKKEFHQNLPSGMQGFVFNTRRSIFKDKKVRQALSLAFDFQWANQNLFYGSYKRTKSYFDNSQLASTGLPDKDEISLLQQFEGQIDPDVFTEVVNFPEVKDGNMRPLLFRALLLLEQSGWHVKDGVLQDAQGHLFQFEILLDSSGAGSWERIVLPYVKNLKKLGVQANVRVMDALQYKHRLDVFDFDMFVFVWGQSLSPGNEQRYFWGSDASQQEGSYNFAGIQDPVVDALIERVVSAKNRRELVVATRALDRILLHGHYVVPHWYLPSQRIVFWNKFGYPNIEPMKGISLMTWWTK